MSFRVRAVGIDLGTTNSAVAYVGEDGSVRVIPNAEGERTTPSVVGLSDDGSFLVGKVAVDQEAYSPNPTMRSIKRHMGTNYRVDAGGRRMSPEEVSAEVLKKLKKDAEDHLGHEVSQAVITVPAYFDSDARQSTKIAGELAGLEVLRVISEPTAAALAYGLDRKESETVLVYDLGGGTFDVSVLKISGDGMFDVQSTSGDTALGGDDFDEALQAFIAGELGIDRDASDTETKSLLRSAAESAKKALSSAAQVTVAVPGVGRVKVDRSTFEALIAPLLERTKTCIELALRDAGLSASKLNEVIFVGGSTRVPLVGRMVEEWTGKKPNRSVNPDEAVAIGAARQAAILSGQSDPDILLVDVIPLTLGVNTASGVMDRMIGRSSPIPTAATKVFTTTEDNQESVAIMVYQGERPKAAANKLLGQFKLEGIPPRPAGIPEVEVTFSVDANGILAVSARELSTGTEASVTLTGNSSLTASEVKKMLEDAEANKKADQEFFTLNKARDAIRARLIQVEGLQREAWAMLSEGTRTELEDAKESLLQAVDSQNLQLLEQLEESCQELAKRASEELAAKAQKLMGRT